MKLRFAIFTTYSYIALLFLLPIAFYDFLPIKAVKILQKTFFREFPRFSRIGQFQPQTYRFIILIIVSLVFFRVKNQRERKVAEAGGR